MNIKKIIKEEIQKVLKEWGSGRSSFQVHSMMPGNDENHFEDTDKTEDDDAINELELASQPEPYADKEVYPKHNAELDTHFDQENLIHPTSVDENTKRKKK